MFDQWRIQREMGMHPTGTHSTPKLAILRSKIEKHFLGRGHSPSPNLYRGEGIPLPTSHPLAAFGRSASTTSPTNDFWIRHCV